MLRSELVLRVAEMNPHLYPRDVEATVDAILDRIEAALTQGDRVELRNFGVFTARQRQPDTKRHPRTGAVIEKGERVAIHSKPGKTAREQLSFGRARQARASAFARRLDFGAPYRVNIAQAMAAPVPATITLRRGGYTVRRGSP